MTAAVEAIGEDLPEATDTMDPDERAAWDAYEAEVEAAVRRLWNRLSAARERSRLRA